MYHTNKQVQILAVFFLKHLMKTTLVKNTNNVPLWWSRTSPLWKWHFLRTKSQIIFFEINLFFWQTAWQAKTCTFSVFSCAMFWNLVCSDTSKTTRRLQTFDSFVWFQFDLWNKFLIFRAEIVTLFVTIISKYGQKQLK